MNHKNRKDQGFTLIELLIVIAIIGILAAVLIPNLLGSRNQAFDTGAMNCGKAIQTAQTSYYGKNFDYADAVGTEAAPILDRNLLAPCLTGSAAQGMQIGSAAPSAQGDSGDDDMAAASATAFNVFVWDTRGSTVYEVTQTEVRAQ